MKALIPIILLLAPLLQLSAQSDEMIAYVPSKPLERTADDMRIAFLEPTIPGILELDLPPGTERVDLLNARGRVKHSLEAGMLEKLDLGKLRRGTWTVRAHSAKGITVRRFVVMGHGTVLWEVPKARRKR